jgi:hypothetical protein
MEQAISLLFAWMPDKPAANFSNSNGDRDDTQKCGSLFYPISVAEGLRIKVHSPITIKPMKSTRGSCKTVAQWIPAFSALTIGDH